MPELKDDKLDDNQKIIAADTDDISCTNAAEDRDSADTKSSDSSTDSDRDAESDNEQDEDEGISLPLSARRSWYDRLEDDEDISLPLSAAQEDGDSDLEFRSGRGQQPAQLALPSEDQISGRSLVVSVIMITAVILLALVSLFVPFLGIIARLFLPLPMLLLTFRWGLKTGIIASVALFGLMIPIFSWQTAMVMALEYGPLSLFLAYCFREGKSPLATLGIAVVIGSMGALAGVMLPLIVSGLPFSDLAVQFEAVFAEFMAMLTTQVGSGLLPAGMTMEMFVQNTMADALRLLPAIMIISAIITSGLSYLISAAILRISKYPINPLPRFSAWHLDWRMSWGIIFGLACYLLGNYLAIAWLHDLGLNFLYLFGFILFVMGLAFMVWVFELDSFFTIFKIMLCILLIFFLRWGVIFLMAMAVFDPILGLRSKINRLLERRKNS